MEDTPLDTIETPEEETPKEPEVETETPEVKPEVEEEKEEEEKPVEIPEPEVRGGAVKSKDEEEEIDPDDKKVITKAIEEATAPLKNEIEVEGFIRENPQFSKYREAMMKYLSHPAYSQIPVKNIAKMIAGDDMQRLGAAKERETQKKVEASKTPGSTVRKSEEGGVDWLKASKEEYEKKRSEVMGYNE